MNKLEVNMYVRTKRDGIGRIISLSLGEEDDCCFIELSNRRTGIKEHNIIKSSYNIIDLIEEGDYVNGNRVVEHAYEPGRLFVENVYVGGKGQTTIENYSYELTSKYCYDETDFIKSIVTKEQMEAMEYRL